MFQTQQHQHRQQQTLQHNDNNAATQDLKKLFKVTYTTDQSLPTPLTMSDTNKVHDCDLVYSHTHLRCLILKDVIRLKIFVQQIALQLKLHHPFLKTVDNMFCDAIKSLYYLGYSSHSAPIVS